MGGTISCSVEIGLANNNYKQKTNQNYTVSKNSILAHLRLQNSQATKASEPSIEPFIWQGDTVMYLINNVQGWQLISADKRACPIVAYAEGEHMSISDIYESSFLGPWVFSVAEDIHTLKHGNYPVDNENTRYWEILEGKLMLTKTEEMEGWRLFRSVLISSTNNDVGPVIPTKWSGSEPWNVAIALFGKHKLCSQQYPLGFGKLLRASDCLAEENVL